jgi:molybdate transport system substrate-binding protein
MKKKMLAAILAAAMAVSMVGCGSSSDSSSTADTQESDTQEESQEVDTQEEQADAGEEQTDNEEEADAQESDTQEETDSTEVFGETTVTIFAAKSLNTVMEDLIAAYNQTQPNVTITGSSDS